MNYFKCNMDNYYQEPLQKVTEGIDFDLIKSAYERNGALLQKAMEGNAIHVLPVISQPTVRSFYIEEDKKGTQRVVYRDSLGLQLKAVEKAIRSDVLIIPAVSCDFNVLTISSIFDPYLVASADLSDANVLPVFKTRQQLEKLNRKDLDQSLVPLIINETKRLRTSLPDYISIGVRINTGPLTVASELRGATEIIYDMLEAPDLYHHFMGILTDLYIEVRKSIHEAAGINLEKGRVRADVLNHTVTNGICICEDNIALLGPNQFEEFAAPYLTRVFNTFGGGTIHSCGDTTHLWPSLANTPGWDGFEFGQLDKIDWVKARRSFPDKNLTFWDSGSDDAIYMESALRAMDRPKTFIYSNNYEHIKVWHEAYYRGGHI